MKSNKWRHASDTIREHLRLPTHPVAIRMFEDEKDIPNEVEMLPGKVLICQLSAYARIHHRATGSIRENMACSVGPACVGMIRTPERVRTGIDVVGMYVKDAKAGKRFQDAVPKLGDTEARYRAVACAPLGTTPFEPHVIAVYATPAQLSRLAHASLYHEGGAIDGTTPVEAGLCAGIAKVFMRGEPVFEFPSTGDRKFAHARDEELVFIFSSERTEQIVEGLEKTREFGMSHYPIRVQLDFEPKLSKAHSMWEEDLKNI